MISLHGLARAVARGRCLAYLSTLSRYCSGSIGAVLGTRPPSWPGGFLQLNLVLSARCQLSVGRKRPDEADATQGFFAASDGAGQQGLLSRHFTKRQDANYITPALRFHGIGEVVLDRDAAVCCWR